MSTSDERSDDVRTGEALPISALVTLIQELTARGIRSTSRTDVLHAAFNALFACVRFDAAVAVMIEQHLELYISTRRGCEASVDGAFADHLRRTVEALIPVSFATTDLVVNAEWHELPERSTASGGAADDISAMLRLDQRIAGVVILDRAEAFSSADREVLEIFAAQLSLLLANVDSRTRIMELADTDDLTGIWNRRYFRRQLPQEIERARVYGLPLSLLMIDVDDFKQINDGFGHTVGDVVLSELCGAVRESLRPPDLFARFGGDEFAIILPHTDLTNATLVAQRILKRAGGVVIPTDEEGAIRCSISIGVAALEGEDTGANDLIRRADERLYDAKRGGKNQVVCSDVE